MSGRRAEIRVAFARRMAAAAMALIGVVGLQGVMPLAGSAHAQEMRISHQFPADIDSRDRAARVFMEEVKKRAPHLQMSLHPALSLKLSVSQQFDEMVSGNLAMCVYTLSELTDKAPEFAIGMMPFVPPDLDAATRLKGSAFHKRLQSAAESNGFHILSWWWMPSGLVSRDREIGGPQTVKGLAVRTPGPTYGRLLGLAAAKPIDQIPLKEINASLRAGKVDVVVTSLESLVGFRVFEAVKFATLGGIGSFMSFQPLMISKSVWDGLTVDEQNAMEEAAEASDRYLTAAQRDIEQKAVEAFTKAGVKVRTLSVDEYEAWSRIAKDSLWPDYRKVSPTSDALFVALIRSLMQAPAVVR